MKKEKVDILKILDKKKREILEIYNFFGKNSSKLLDSAILLCGFLKKQKNKN